MAPNMPMGGAPNEAAPAPTKSPEGLDRESALLPAALFPGGVEPGQTVTLEVISVQGDEIEVAAAAPKEASPMDEAYGALDSLAEEE